MVRPLALTLMMLAGLPTLGEPTAVTIDASSALDGIPPAAVRGR